MKAKWTLFATSLLVLASCGGGGEGKKEIGVLQFGSFTALEEAKRGFVEVINASKWKNKVNITVKDAAANGADNISMANTLAVNSDLVYGVATPSASALKNALGSLGADTPLLFAAVTNPIGANLLKNMDAPEGNCTGVVDLGPIAKELEILTKFPSINKVCSFFTSSEVNSSYQADIAEGWMDAHNIAHERKTITNAAEISSAFTAISDDVDAIFLPTDDTIANSITRLKAANDARTKKLIIVGSDTGMIEGCTFALGVDFLQCGKQAGEMALKILDGTPIKSIPVEQCSKDNVVINKTLATSLGIDIPSEVLSMQGAEVI